MEGTRWYKLSVDEVLDKLHTSPHGLTGEEAKRRLEEYGPNELSFKRPSAWKRFLRQFRNPLVYILLGAAGTTTALSFHGEDMIADTIIIMAVIILNAILGFFQEGKAENALLALQKMIVPECDVYRDGAQHMVLTRELVPGDVVILNGGDKIPADCRFFVSNAAVADEAVLTGESVPVEKNTQALDANNLPPGDQICMGFSGTFLVRGHALGVVTSTGTKTEFGKIASLVNQTQHVVTPLQKKIVDFTRVLIIAILGVGVINFGLGTLFGYTLTYSFLASVSLIVAAIPEMLPMIVTAILALSATRMAKKNALIRRLPAAETLGCATVICSDKTGTLTRNEMTVVRCYAGGKEFEVQGAGYESVGKFLLEGVPQASSAMSSALKKTLAVGCWCNNAVIELKNGRHTIIGAPTEGALIVSAQKAGISRLDEEPLDEIPFNSEQCFMATLHEGETCNVVYVKGSPERVLGFCDRQLHEGEKVFPLDRQDVLDKAESMARGALRVISMALKEVPKEQTSISEKDIKGLVFLGLQGIIDPPRAEAIEAVGNCKSAGIRTVMITGDHVLTAKAIALQMGIVESAEAPALIGEELVVMSDEDLDQCIEEVSVFARVAPEHKLRIAQRLQKHRHIVAMTGDGVNDAPALKAADIGISMGISGTEVSKEASAMILTDDNFASITNAVEEGRHAWNNIEKAILYTLPTNSGQAMLVMGAVLLAPFVTLFSFRLPLEPVQILWINLFDSVFLTMPLMMEAKDGKLLTLKPRSPDAKIANMLFLQRVLFMGLAIAIPGFLIYHHFGSPAVVGGELVDAFLLSQAQTAAFWAVLLVHLGFVMSARSVFDSAFTFSPFTNKWLMVGIILSLLSHLALTFVPFMSSMFRTEVFPAEWWPFILACLLPGFVVLEVDKALRKAFGKKD